MPLGNRAECAQKGGSGADQGVDDHNLIAGSAQPGDSEPLHDAMDKDQRPGNEPEVEAQISAAAQDRTEDKDQGRKNNCGQQTVEIH